MSVAAVPKRDYSLTGRDTKLAEERGLADAQWYASDIPRQRMRELMQRRNGPAARDTLIWFAVLITSGVLGHLNWATWWALPCFLVYGVIYASSSDSRWHESLHRTAFKTVWLNDALYEIASFMVFRESVSWRWSHTRHHTDTIIVGRDPEIAVPRPPDLLGVLMAFFVLKSAPKEFLRMLKHSFGHLTPAEATYIPASEHSKVFRNARIYILIYASVAGTAIATQSILPLMYIGLPSLYGSWLMVVFGLTQHAGLAEDVLDHRLNCRTVYMNPIFRFLYWEMNYHVEHHMFPMVPYHALGKLHQELKADMPKPYSGLWEAYREIIPTLFRQVKNPPYFVQRQLPPTARPFLA
ncbi:MAG: fatty acid desaturase family protein [Candidatus Latescibacteria bacterium]|nr:fatty acid desaturase family protein [Candidatus Latescibacterota bacterium]